MASTVYLIPSLLSDDNTAAIPAYIVDAVRQCSVLFVENERSARRYLKRIWKEMVIDDYTWHTIHKAEAEVTGEFRQAIRAGRTIGIISEAGCPGIADPGQVLVAVAHGEGAIVRPLVGPSSILLALMASGLNGQQFRFTGYLPIDQGERMRAIKELEAESRKKNCTEIFIETPYRNNQLLDAILQACASQTMLCIAVNITGADESIQTKTVEGWKKAKPDLNRKPVIFCLMAK